MTCTYLDNKQNNINDNNNKKSIEDCNMLLLVRQASSRSVVTHEVHHSISMPTFTAIE
jgi:hypothetical protein